MAPKGVACEQALHFEISWKVDAREARERRRSRVLARLASLAQIGELARRLPKVLFEIGLSWRRSCKCGNDRFWVRRRITTQSTVDLGERYFTSKRFIGWVFYLSLTNFGIKYFSSRWIDNEKDPGKGKVDCSYMKQQSWYLSLQLVQLITCYYFVRWLVHHNKHLMIKNKEK